MEEFYRWAKTVRCEGRIGGPSGFRTRVTDVRGRCPRPLDDGTFVGFWKMIQFRKLKPTTKPG